MYHIMHIMHIMFMIQLCKGNTTHSDIPTITTSIKEFVQFFGDTYYVEEELDHKMVTRLASLIESEYGSALRGIVEKIILFGDSTTINGLYRDNVIAVSSKSIESFHHELMHFFASTTLHPDDKNDWIDINNYPYVGDKYNEIKLRQGYVSKYAMSSLGEDMAETYHELMTLEKRKTGMQYDTYMIRKFELLVSFFDENDALSDIVCKKLDELRKFSYSTYIRAHTSRSEPTVIPSNMVRVSLELRGATLALYCGARLPYSNGYAILQLPCERGTWYVFDVWGGISQGDGKSGRRFDDYMNIAIGDKSHQVRGSDLAWCFHSGYVGDIL